MKTAGDRAGFIRHAFRPCLAAAVAHLAMTGPSARAHPDTWHTIELLTERIATGDQRAAIYYARATEYRSVEKWMEAEADLRHCLARDSEFFQARLDLGPVLLAAGRPDEALAAAREAARMAEAQPDRHRAAAWAGVARIERTAGNWPGVLAATDQALRWAPRGEVDWYLLREEAFRGEGRLADAIADLARADAVLHSSRIRMAWIDTLIDSNRPADALPLIDKAMADTPFQAPLLIRRGRARASLGRRGEALVDWEAALAAANGRLVPEEPDPGLLVVKGLALAELGRHTEAESSLAAARSLFPDPSLVGPLERALSPLPRPSKTPLPPAPLPPRPHP